MRRAGLVVVMAVAVAGCPAPPGPPVPPIHLPTPMVLADEGVTAAQLTTSAVDRCRPTSDPDGQSRTELKHRRPPHELARLTQAGYATRAPSSLFALEPPCADGRCDVDRAFADEERTLVIAGDIWRVKLDKGDCDLHLEIADAGAGREAGRLIVEIPNDLPFTPLRHLVDDLVATRTGRRLRAGAAKNLTSPIPVEILGLPFWDGHHACKRDRLAGCAHGTAQVRTLWELHPAVGLAAR